MDQRLERMQSLTHLNKLWNLPSLSWSIIGQVLMSVYRLEQAGNWRNFQRGASSIGYARKEGECGLMRWRLMALHGARV